MSISRVIIISVTATLDIPYTELRRAAARAARAEERAAEARADRDRLIEELYAAGVPQTCIARQLGISQSYVSQRLSARRREQVQGHVAAARHNEPNHAARLTNAAVKEGNN